MAVRKNQVKHFIFRLLAAYCVLGVMPVYAFEYYPFVMEGNLQLSAIDQLVLFSSEMDSFDRTLSKEAQKKEPILVQGEPESVSSQTTGQGNLPLPLAQLSSPKFSRQELQQQKLGDLGGTPYGQLTGKSTFGKVEDDSSIQNLLQDRGTASFDSLNQDWNSSLESEGPLTQEQILEVENKLALFRDEISRVAFKMEPYQKMDYKAYESAKSFFSKHEKIISRLNDFEEGFVKNAKELFVNYSWRDMDKAGKRPYEAFIDRQEPRISFPYPKGQEPKPTTHPGGISH